MKRIIYVPLERLDGRYTNHLDRDILSYFNDNNIPHFYLPAPFKEPPASGFFLNAAQTIMNKSHQMEAIARCYQDGNIDDNTIFFFSDLWFPGIESIAYLNHFYDIKPEIRGIIHAGSFTDTDEVRHMERWATGFENIVFDLADKVFLGSQFIKHQILERRLVNFQKLIVTGLPLDSSLNKYHQGLPWDKRKNIVVFNGRNHSEKQPWLFEALKERLRGYEFIWTQKMNLTKDEYYKILCEAKVVVSFALQENFGYGVMEAVKLGCMPVVPDRLAYKEFYSRPHRYEMFEECIELVDFYMRVNYQPCNPLIKEFSNHFKIWFQ